MKCQILFKGQNKTNVANLSTAELAEWLGLKSPRKQINNASNNKIKPFLLIHVHYLDKKM